MNQPCPTCRIEVEHRIALDHAIRRLTPTARTHWRIRGKVRQYKAARRRSIERHAAHLLKHAETEEVRAA